MIYELKFNQSNQAALISRVLFNINVEEYAWRNRTVRLHFFLRRRLDSLVERTPGCHKLLQRNGRRRGKPTETPATLSAKQTSQKEEGSGTAVISPIRNNVG